MRCRFERRYDRDQPNASPQDFAKRADEYRHQQLRREQEEKEHEDMEFEQRIADYDRESAYYRKRTEQVNRESDEIEERNHEARLRLQDSSSEDSSSEESAPTSSTPSVQGARLRNPVTGRFISRR